MDGALTCIRGTYSTQDLQLASVHKQNGKSYKRIAAGAEINANKMVIEYLNRIVLYTHYGFTK